MFRKRNKYRRYNSYSSYSRRSRVRWDRIAVVVGGCAVVLAIVIGLNFNRIQLMFKGYSFSQQNQILSLDKDAVKNIVAYDKLDQITEWISISENYDYYDEYQQYYAIHTDYEFITVVTEANDIFDNYVPKFVAMGYTDAQIWDILKTADLSDLQYLINKKYTYSQIEPYMQVNGFKFTDMEGYIKAYDSYKNYNYAVLITTYPFIDASNEATVKYTIQNPDSILNLVKVGFELPSSYEPSDLVTPDMPIAPDCENYQLRQEAAQALEKMYVDAKNEGYYLVLNSAYRSYQKQVDTYNSFENRYGGLYAQEHVAKPGASEHQTGLGVDLTSESVIKGDRLVFGDTEEYQWVLKNAYKYGYILRFPEGKSDFTGIVHEPWHFRYVGVEAATKIYENDWTLEDYCLYEGIIPQIK